ncbi:MAG: transglycosylase SLT domain-containing protein [Candidatus Berkiella sp.]
MANKLSLSVNFILLLIFSMSCAHGSAQDITSMRQNFIKAEKFITENNWKEYERLKPKLILYPLYSYLIYKELKQKIQTRQKPSISYEEILQFERANPDFPFLDTLKTAWARQQSESKNWDNVIKLYQDGKNIKKTEDECYYLHSLYQTRNDSYILTKIQALWFVGHSQPTNCNILFTILKTKGILTTKDTIERIKLALAKQNYKLAEFLISSLPPTEKRWADKWMIFVHAPENIFDQKKLKAAFFPENIKTEVLTTALQTLARKNPAKALEWWNAHERNYPFSKEQSQRIKRDIGVFLSHQKTDTAYAYISRLPEEKLDNVAKEWRIRLSLFEGKWSDTLKWIRALPETEKSKHIWRYWQARAMESLGSHESAKAIYQEIATYRGYYGFLSSLKLDKRLTLNNHKFNVSTNTLEGLKHLQTVQRVEELLALDRTRIARVEWYQLTKNIPDLQLLHLAHLAFTKGWYDLSILALTKSEYKDDISLRFPLAHQKPILYYAQKFDLDPAWIFALTRQESAFFHNAISPVGARGLMQLMPATATYIAEKNNINILSSEQLFLPEKNIELGATYLKYLNDKYNKQPILATASYNAGPGRIKRWMPNHTMDADIWVENIPYAETRDYVKNVMTSTSIYHELLGHPEKLSTYMQPISGKN